MNIHIVSLFIVQNILILYMKKILIFSFFFNVYNGLILLFYVLDTFKIYQNNND